MAAVGLSRSRARSATALWVAPGGKPATLPCVTLVVQRKRDSKAGSCPRCSAAAPSAAAPVITFRRGQARASRRIRRRVGPLHAASSASVSREAEVGHEAEGGRARDAGPDALGRHLDAAQGARGQEGRQRDPRQGQGVPLRRIVDAAPLAKVMAEDALRCRRPSGRTVWVGNLVKVTIGQAAHGHDRVKLMKTSRSSRSSTSPSASPRSSRRASGPSCG